MEPREIKMELEVERSQWLDPKLMKSRDLLIFEDGTREFVHRVMGIRVTTWSVSDSKALHRTYNVHKGTIGTISLSHPKVERYGRESHTYKNIKECLGGILL